MVSVRINKRSIFGSMSSTTLSYALATESKAKQQKKIVENEEHLQLHENWEMFLAASNMVV